MLSLDQRTIFTEAGSILLPIPISLAATTICTDWSIACWTSCSRFFNAEYTTSAATSAAKPASKTKIIGLLIYPLPPDRYLLRRVDLKKSANTHRVYSDIAVSELLSVVGKLIPRNDLPKKRLPVQSYVIATVTELPKVRGTVVLSPLQVPVPSQMLRVTFVHVIVGDATDFI